MTPMMTNPEYWNDRMGYGGARSHERSCWDSIDSSEGGEEVNMQEVPKTVGQKLKKGLKAIFSPSAANGVY
jgi:hypothetical protein